MGRAWWLLPVLPWDGHCLGVVLEPDGTLDPSLQGCECSFVGSLGNFVVDCPIHAIPHVHTLEGVAVQSSTKDPGYQAASPARSQHWVDAIGRSQRFFIAIPTCRQWQRPWVL